MGKATEWFGEWFNSPYYHILYKHRDFEDAQAFIDHLHAHFGFSPQHHVLDLACGKGRHSIYLNAKGIEVTGVDLSEANIAHAREFANDRLHFDVHDMRAVYKTETFDYVLNLFTSFGYFETDEEHQQAIAAAAQALVPGGRLILDFLNPFVVVNNLKPLEEKVIEGITFHLHKRFEEGYIVKDIRFTDKGSDYHFFERVKAIRRWDFERYFTQAGLSLLDTFGDYSLSPYEAESSDRMIFVAQKEAHVD